MKIALNVGILHAPKTGIGQYVTNLFYELSKKQNLEFHLFGGFNWSKSLPNASIKGYSSITNSIKRFIPNAYDLRRFIFQWRFSSGVKKIKPDLYHEPSLWPFTFDGPKVMTIHDLTHLHFPETQPKDRLKEISKRIESGIESSAKIITDSEFIKNDIINHYNVDSSKISTVHLGVSDDFKPKSKSEWISNSNILEYKKYILCIGTLEPRKNLILALRGYLDLPKSIQKQYPLVFIGGMGWNSKEQNDFLNLSYQSENVHFSGYIDDDKIKHLISGAKMILYTSLYEGFGLPILEAMASGVPCILTKNASLPEVGGDAALYIDDDIKSCSNSILNYIEDEIIYNTKIELGLKRVKLFTWENCANKTLRVYEEVLKKS